MPRKREIQLMADVATEHFLQGLSKVEIAQRHHISRFQVARLLDQARDEGILQIRVVNPLDSGDRQTELAELLGIASVTVVTRRPGETLRSALARQAAQLLMNQLDDGVRLGVAWSRTLMHLPEHLQTLPAVDVVQLVGPLSAPGTSASASSSLIHSLGALAGGQVWPLPTPLMVDHASVAQSLRSMAEVAAALEAADALDMAVVSVGAWAEGASTLWSRLSQQERQRASEAGVVAECSGILVDGQGRVARSGMDDRVIGVDPEQLRRAHVVALAPAQDHPEAVIAAVRAGFVDDLVLTEDLAAQVGAALRRSAVA